MFAAAAAKLLQSCPTLCNPTDGGPPGSSIHGIFQAKVLEWGAIAFSGTAAWKQEIPPFKAGDGSGALEERGHLYLPHGLYVKYKHLSPPRAPEPLEQKFHKPQGIE